MTGRRQAVSGEAGFTLIELLMVLIIIGILLTIAVPSYLGFKDRANKSAAQANVRAGIPAVETYFADNNTYAGMDKTSLAKYDAGIKVSVASGATTSMYCIYDTVGGFQYYNLLWVFTE